MPTSDDELLPEVAKDIGTDYVTAEKTHSLSGHAM